MLSEERAVSRSWRFSPSWATCWYVGVSVFERPLPGHISIVRVMTGRLADVTRPAVASFGDGTDGREAPVGADRPRCEGTAAHPHRAPLSNVSASDTTARFPLCCCKERLPGVQERIADDVAVSLHRTSDWRHRRRQGPGRAVGREHRHASASLVDERVGFWLTVHLIVVSWRSGMLIQWPRSEP